MSPIVSLDRWFRDDITQRMEADARRRVSVPVAAAGGGGG
jgi:hypothetical protein